MAKKKTPKGQRNGGDQQPARPTQGKMPVIVRRPPRHQGR